MHGPALSGWLLMGLCAATGAYCLLRTRDGTERERGSARAEALMGFGMAAMAVPPALLTLPEWMWVVHAVVFGAAALHAVVRLRDGGHHPHHAVGSLAMVYMAVAMAPGAAHASGGGHLGHGAQPAGGVPALTGVLLVYYALYVLGSAGRLIPAPVGVPAGAGAPTTTTGPVWDARPELALACRLTMGIAMFAMLLTL
ncbi:MULTISPECIES: DUF5134 domain-containing protein [Streptomyces]|uniref:DUF5134 domain-containing protein n=1 Tax=Streptomyces glycanivorans TaxID=3033808 RepID=A0ABY9JKC5_9ACTN|nr:MULTISPECIES: DUF5134 domain-containing protein [unclassified Streptomyces]WSQ81530.1 DUF5134 domain-containing protein [Streptomyces sp. NBC_01213]TXS10716.1 DUF5134 domain-containing protein [Streptomyces sp. wa22]WLQ68175.1 DUF5134 domain-containing protein [Streptomyces sp. Alt3]WSQ88857.1 DUF5134 domain-containing protein [Streptomyces sp. NBC_01212]WSR05138.1 DUF5134 domain-containing protein [Streptomyces sp. NBC_01208]